jgi:hypothetical protein
MCASAHAKDAITFRGQFVHQPIQKTVSIPLGQIISRESNVLRDHCAVQPPSMTSSLPVTNEASSEAR